jgi:hypothetical protein
VLAAIAEELVLHRAVGRGLLTPWDLESVAPLPPGGTRLRFDPTLDALIAAQRISEDAVERLCQELLQESAASAAHAQTVAGAPRPADVIGQARTLDSAVAQQQVVIASGSVSPVPSWDKYEFLGLLGRGGMGAVYRARDRRLDRVVALKFIHDDNPAQAQRFMQEARAQARLDHSNICKVFEVGVVEGKPYIAMQLVHGLPLDRASRAMTLVEKVQVMKDIAEAMHVAHEQGIIHRDIKPANVAMGLDRR